jgi:esterase/lipase
MRTLFLCVRRIFVAILIFIALAWVIIPREPVDREISFDASLLGGDLDVYLAEQEAQFSDITNGVEKRIVWSGEPGEIADVAILYIHGYSATSEEIRPVPDILAENLNANLFYTRLTGHGRTGPAMAEAEAGDWIEDMAEAVAIGKRIGREIIVVSTSTGGTVSAIAATHPKLRDEIKGIAFISPNFQIKSKAAIILTWPLVRYWAPILVGPERSFEPINDGQAKYWTTRYPTTSVMPMAALVAHADGLDFGDVSIPALFMFSDDDAVVSAEKTREISLRWGGPVQTELAELGPGDDPFNHVIAGDILSPGQTAKAADILTDWVRNLD